MALVWTAEKIDRLVALWSEGLSASQVADRLSLEFRTLVSRSAICGKVARLQLTRGNHHARNASSVIVAPRRERLRRPEPSKRKPQQQTGDEVLAAIRAEERTRDPATLIAFHDLADHHCRYPYGEAQIRYCGRQRVLGLPYCEDHARVCYPGLPLPTRCLLAPEASEPVMEAA